jgi:hypothetical protein
VNELCAPMGECCAWKEGVIFIDDFRQFECAEQWALMKLQL